MELLPEVEVWYVLPAIRRQLAAHMKELGLSQKEVAERLGIAESAVSQYLSGKRGASHLPKNLDPEFEKSAKKIVQNKETMPHEIMRLSELLKKTKVICDIHKQHSDVPKGCKQCFD